jgi:GNAT superfamily N-acetyltransferase
VTCDGRVVATGLYTQYISRYDPRRFHIWEVVRPDYQGRGIGSILYDQIEAALGRFDPIALRTQVREDHTVGIAMLERRGFKEYLRDGESHLDVTAFDPSPYSGIEDRLRRQGIEIKTLRELKGDPDRDRKLYDLDWEVTRDEPGSGDDTRVDFETFVRDGINASSRLPDGYFVAVHGSEYIGLCLLNANKADRTLDHGITGVRRAYRRRGIATAMKVRAIEYAQEHGHPTIKTGNRVGNRAMLAINKRLGFVRQRDWISYEKICA